MEWKRHARGDYRAECNGKPVRILQLVSGKWEILPTQALEGIEYVPEHYTLTGAKDHVGYHLIVRHQMHQQISQPE